MEVVEHDGGATSIASIEHSSGKVVWILWIYIYIYIYELLAVYGKGGVINILWSMESLDGGEKLKFFQVFLIVISLLMQYMNKIIYMFVSDFVRLFRILLLLLKVIFI